MPVVKCETTFVAEAGKLKIADFAAAWPLFYESLDHWLWPLNCKWASPQKLVR